MKIKYKDNTMYVGPKSTKPKWLHGASAGQVRQHLKEHKQRYPQYWIDLTEGTYNEPVRTEQPQVAPECKHLTTITVRGNWGPHRAKKMCIDCKAWIKWVSAAK